jgi:hypothetical protein
MSLENLSVRAVAVGGLHTCVTLWVLGLPVPQVSAHSLQILRSSEAKLPLSKRWVRCQIRNIASAASDTTQFPRSDCRI